MKLYLTITKMNFSEDNIEHCIIRGILNKEFIGYDEIVELPDDDEFIKSTIRETKEGIVFDIKEKNTWWGLPLYELKDGAIINFDYTQYAYFANTNRRNMLAAKINELYNPSAEAKLVRKTLKKILDHLEIIDEDFEKYNSGVNEIIEKNPKND